MIDDFDIQVTPEEYEDEYYKEEDWIEFEPGRFIYDEMAANP